ncbi:MAG: hypothetical protein IKF72_04535 [Kiritimatiellae bacterium]|nr:hypothetical protein [Kiritimatiellia bacterium]
MVAATVYVDDDWAGQGGDGSLENPFGTLQEAELAMSTLDKMSVADGSYAGDVDFGSKIITNDVPFGTAKVAGSVKTAGAFYRTGAGTLLLNGQTNEFAALSLAPGSTTVVAPVADGVTNVLTATSLPSYGCLVASNTVTRIRSAATLDIYGGSYLSFVGGSLTMDAASGTAARYLRFGLGPDKTTATMVLDGVDATVSAYSGLFFGQYVTKTKSSAELIITNDTTLSLKAFQGRHGTVRQYGGKVDVYFGWQEAFALSYDNGGTVDYYLYGGTLDKSAENDYYARIGGANHANYNNYTSTGRLFVHGGEAIFRCRYCTLGTGTKHTGVVEVKNGGTFTMTRANSEVAVGNRGDGTFEVSDGGVATINGSVIALAASAGGRTANVSILTNGTLKARRLVSNANANEDDTAILVLDGGKMIANTSAAAEFMQGFTAASVGVGGVVIDTAGQNLTIAQSFAARPGQSAPVAATAAQLAAIPAFTKAGEGTLSLTGDNEWLCATCVSNGTLVVGEDALPSTTTLQLRGGVIDLGGNSFTIANLVGHGTVSNGTLTVTGAVWPGVYGAGTLTIDSTATLSLTKLGCCVASDGTCGCLEVAGTQNLAGVTVVGEGMENKTHRGLTLVKASAIVGAPAADASLAGNCISLVRGTLRVGAPGFIISFW